jgi:hypothetical protein
MDDNKKNSFPVFLLFFLLVFFFSFIHLEKEKQLVLVPVPMSVISDGSVCGFQAIIGPATSTPGIDYSRICMPGAKWSCINCSSGREFIFSQLIASSFGLSQDKFLLKKPIIRLIFLQKVPEQGKDDDLFPVS